MWRRILTVLGEVLAAAGLFFLLWVGLWAAHLFA